MKQLFFPLLAALFLSTSLSAQHFGLRVGVNATNAKFNFQDRELETEGETNLALGIFATLPVLSETFTLQPEFTYLNRGYSVDANIGDFLSFDRTVAYVDLGVLARLNFGSEEGLGFYVGAGPQYSYAVSGTYSDVRGERDVDFDGDRLNRGEVQFAAVGGLTFTAGLRFFVEARYNGSLGNQSSNELRDVKQRSVGINGGVMVPL